MVTRRASRREISCWVCIVFYSHRSQIVKHGPHAPVHGGCQRVHVFLLGEQLHRPQQAHRREIQLQHRSFPAVCSIYPVASSHRVVREARRQRLAAQLLACGGIQLQQPLLGRRWAPVVGARNNPHRGRHAVGAQAFAGEASVIDALTLMQHCQLLRLVIVPHQAVVRCQQ